MHADPDLYPLRDWCRENRVGISTAYRMIANGKLRITKLGKRSYLSREARADFLKSLNHAA